ncbi:hypothetical protein R1flu_017590 [Riccia fluitans]|uniref:Uncharacterized protein n=1 Tax=Riccia fluitans TaxID=41844 RepID=A0ABD1ZEG0_9MARC
MSWIQLEKTERNGNAVECGYQMSRIQLEMTERETRAGGESPGRTGGQVSETRALSVPPGDRVQMLNASRAYGQEKNEWAD